MAILTKTVFKNPYVAVGTDIDICEDCLREYLAKHPNEEIYTAKKALGGKLTGELIFKQFRNSNTPYVLCKKHFNAIYAELNKGPKTDEIQ